MKNFNQYLLKNQTTLSIMSYIQLLSPVLMIIPIFIVSLFSPESITPGSELAAMWVISAIMAVTFGSISVILDAKARDFIEENKNTITVLIFQVISVIPCILFWTIGILSIFI